MSFYKCILEVLTPQGVGAVDTLIQGQETGTWRKLPREPPRSPGGYSMDTCWAFIWLPSTKEKKYKIRLVIRLAQGQVAPLGKGFALRICWSKWLWACLTAQCEQRVWQQSRCHPQSEEKLWEVGRSQQRGTNATARFREATGRLSNEQSGALLAQVKDRQVKGSQRLGISTAPVPTWGPVSLEKLEPSIESVKQELPHSALPSLPSRIQTQKSKLASGGRKVTNKKETN